MKIPLRITLMVVALWAASNPAMALQMNLEWGIVESTCEVPSGVLTFACGSYGQLLVGSQSGTVCTYLGNNDNEVVEAYPKPWRTHIRQVPSLPGGPITPLVSLPNAAGPTAPPEPPVPCDQGACFGPPGGGGSNAWVAIADWNDWHGWTVGATVQMLSQRPVSLFSLDDPSITQALGSTVNDGHVLATICSLVEMIETDGLNPPAVLNLSFGRKPSASELAPAGDCDPNVISCQIRQVLDHLKSLDVLLVGSAGNHGSFLFPAGVDSVLGAGTLDMAAFRWGQTVAPSWETPPEATALTPGYGLCLPFPEGPDVGGLWPAPAGSSYSAAILAGWLVDGAADNSLPDPLPGMVHPVWSSELGCYVLSQDLNPRCNPAANDMLQQMLGQTSQNCWSQSFVQPFLLIKGPVPPLANGLTIPSIEEWISTTSPAPSSDFCVPCVSGGGWEFAAPTGPGQEEKLGYQAAGAATGGGSIILDISASGGINNGQTLEGLYLRIEQDFYPLLERSAGQGDLLDELIEGTYRRLVLERFAALIPSRATQPSLIYVISPTGSTAEYWTSTPVLLSAPAGRNLGGAL